MKKSAFTLVEILVVLAIVSLLSALSFAAFGRVRENGRRTTCQSNLKQIFAGVSQYVADYDAKFPEGRQWTQAIAPYAKSQQIFRCPSQELPPNLKSDYVFNTPRLNTQLLIGNEKKLSGINESVIAYAAKATMMTDNGVDSREVPAPKDCVLTLHWQAVDAYVGSRIHSGGGNYLFVDGHVKWLTPEAAAQSECDAGPWQTSFS